jgi:hypothetical protein
MKEFAITFGFQYDREPHPFFSLAHPQGFIVIEADDEEDARMMAYAHLGSAWAFIYETDSPVWVEFSPAYTKGELARWTHQKENRG